MLETRQLQYFVEAARCGTFSAAAKKAGVTEQALSKSIRSLEAALGKELFARTPSGLELTRFGRFFLKRAKIVVDAALLAEKSALDFDGGSRRFINLGIPSLCLEERGGTLNVAKLVSLQEGFDDVVFGCVELPIGAIEKGLVDGNLQFGIGVLMPKGEFASFELGSYDLAVVAHRDSALARKDVASLGEVARYKHALPGNDATGLGVYGNRASRISVSPLRLDTDDPADLIVDEQTVLVMPEQHALRTVDRARVSVVPLVTDEGERVRVPLELSWRKGLRFDNAELSLARHVASLYGREFQVAGE